eukprot:scaffold14009_cov110-Isochrysis_galbana.AAC.1
MKPPNGANSHSGARPPVLAGSDGCQCPPFGVWRLYPSRFLYTCSLASRPSPVASRRLPFPLSPFPPSIYRSPRCVARGL